MSYNTYSPLYLGRNNKRRVYEVGDELAPGGPVSYWRSNRGRNNGMDNQYQYNQRQYDQQMNEPPRDLWEPPPLTRLRQPMFRPQRYSPFEDEGPFFHQEPLSPRRRLQQEFFPSFRVPRRTPPGERVFSPEQQFQREPIFPVEQFDEFTQPEEFMPVRSLRQPTWKQERFSSVQLRRPPSQQQPISRPEQRPVPEKILPMKQMRWPSPEPRQLSPELHQPSRDLYQPFRELNQPSRELHQPSPELRQPSRELHQPSRDLYQPSRELHQPSPELHQPSRELHQPSPELHQPSRELHQPSRDLHQPSPPPQPSPPLCEDTEGNQSNAVQITKEATKTGKSEPVKKSSDKSHTENTSGNHAGVKVKKRVGNREWRRRQNLHLRRILAPKNAIIVLNEMLPGDYSIGQFKVEPAPSQTDDETPNMHYFCAKLTVDGVEYTGYGRSKLAARNDAAEQVFRDLILKHMVKLQRRYEGRARSMERAQAQAEGDSSDEEGSLPMIQLASFALHKLFADWEGRGHKVPHLRQLAPPAPNEEGQPTDCIPRGPKVRVVPTNAGAMHPCLLLAQLHPDLQFREQSTGPPYSITVDVDGVTYRGIGASKREARKAAARAACAQHFGVKYDDDPAPAPAPEHEHE